jgi:hypothetical protein
MWMFFGILIAGYAIRWFVSGQSAEASLFWNIGVVAQLLGGIALAVYGWQRSKRLENIDKNKQVNSSSTE